MAAPSWRPKLPSTPRTVESVTPTLTWDDFRYVVLFTNGDTEIWWPPLPKVA